MNGVIYARFSSDNQREESIEGQLRICKEYAAKNNITIINEYIDRALTGRTDKRPSFKKMIADSDTKLFQAVVVYSMDRFGRNGNQFSIYENMLNVNGVQLFSATENINSTPSSIILKSVLKGMAEYYSVELAAKITRGLTENALKGKWTSGTVPFGYTRDKDKYLIPHPINSHYVKDIFEMFLSGKSQIDIARYLNDQGIRTATGGAWNKGSFHKLLVNRVYIGEFTWKNIKMTDSVPPLVPLELFYKVQKVLEMRKTNIKTKQPSEDYPLSGRAYCSHCGGRLKGMSGTSKNKTKKYYYVCANKRTHKTECPLPNISKEYLEGALAEYLNFILSKEENIKAIAKYAMTAQDADKDNSELVKLQAQQKDLKKKVDNFVNAIANGLISDAVVSSLKEAEAALDNVKRKIAEQNILLHASLLTEAQIVFFLKRMADNIKDKPEEVLQALVRSVFVEYKKDSDEYIITAHFNYASTPSMPDMQEMSVRPFSPMVEMRGETANHTLLQVFSYSKNSFGFSFRLPRLSPSKVQS